MPRSRVPSATDGIHPEDRLLNDMARPNTLVVHDAITGLEQRLRVGLFRKSEKLGIVACSTAVLETSPGPVEQAPWRPPPAFQQRCPSRQPTRVRQSPLEKVANGTPRPTPEVAAGIQLLQHVWFEPDLHRSDRWISRCAETPVGIPALRSGNRVRHCPRASGGLKEYGSRHSQVWINRWSAPQGDHRAIIRATPAFPGLSIRLTRPPLPGSLPSPLNEWNLIHRATSRPTAGRGSQVVLTGKLEMTPRPTRQRARTASISVAERRDQLCCSRTGEPCGQVHPHEPRAGRGRGRSPA